MLNLLSLASDNRHWKFAKKNRRENISLDAIPLMVIPKKPAANERARECKSYVIQFRNHLKNFNPVKNEVILPFETVVQFYKSVYPYLYHLQLFYYLSIKL